MIQLKPLLAKNFNLRAQIDPVLEKAARNIGNDMVEDFRRPTRTWEHKPNFRSVREFTQTTFTIRVSLVEGPDAADIYTWVDEGTKEHEIDGGLNEETGKRKMLKLPQTFSAKTVPGTLSSRQGERSGEHLVRGPVKQSIEARNFSGTVAVKWDLLFLEKIGIEFGKVSARFNDG